MFMQNQATFATGLAQSAMIDLEATMFPAALARSGLIEGTRLEAADGWRPVESLMRGDAVFTFDGGLRQIKAIHRQQIKPARALLVPGGALDNCARMMLLPGQHMLLEDTRAEAAFGSPLALVPAAALAGFRGIKWTNWQTKSAEIVTLEFEEEEVVYGNTGALFHCPDATQHATQFRAEGLCSEFFKVLRLDQARAMVGLMAADELGAAASEVSRAA